MSHGTCARLAALAFALLCCAARAPAAELLLETVEIEGSQQRLDGETATNGPLSGALPHPPPPPPIAFDAAHAGGWLGDYGIACPRASTIWPNASGNEFATTGVLLRFTDSFVITAPGRTGTGFVDVEIGLGGELSAAGASSRAGYNADLSLEASGHPPLARSWFGECFAADSPCSSDLSVGDPFGTYPMPGEPPLRAQFTFGEPLVVQADLDADAEAGQSDQGAATSEPELRWLGIVQVLDASMAPVGSYSVTPAPSASGFDYARAAGQCASTGSPSLHDFAFTSAKPKKVSLRGGPVTSEVKLSIQNRGTHDETIPDQATLEDLVPYTVESLGACPIASSLSPPKSGFPAVIRPKRKLTLALVLSIGCVNDPAASTKDEDHSDFRLTFEVEHAALGAPDDVPANDVCPRAPAGADKGCGPKTGGDILVDVIEK